MCSINNPFVLYDIDENDYIVYPVKNEADSIVANMLKAMMQSNNQNSSSNIDYQDIQAVKELQAAKELQAVKVLQAAIDAQDEKDLQAEIDAQAEQDALAEKALQYLQSLIYSKETTSPNKIGETPVGETPVGETPVGETPVGETPVGETPVGEIQVAEIPMDEIPMDKTPLGETPVSAQDVLVEMTVRPEEPSEPTTTSINTITENFKETFSNSLLGSPMLTWILIIVLILLLAYILNNRFHFIKY
jgi:hypothetical protein